MQAAIHHNLPYSSLYGRINRLKKENPADWSGFNPDLSLEAFIASGTQSEASLLNNKDFGAVATHIRVPAVSLLSQGAAEAK